MLVKNVPEITVDYGDGVGGSLSTEVTASLSDRMHQVVGFTRTGYRLDGRLTSPRHL